MKQTRSPWPSTRLRGSRTATASLTGAVVDDLDLPDAAVEESVERESRTATVAAGWAVLLVGASSLRSAAVAAAAAGFRLEPPPLALPPDLLWPFLGPALVTKRSIALWLEL